MNSKTWSFAGAVLLALGGCAPTNTGIEIEGLLASGEGCVYMPSASSTMLVTPVLDTGPSTALFNAGGIHYAAAFQVVNRMLNRASSTYPLMTDTNSFHVEEAEVELRALDGTPLPLGDLPSRFRVPASGFIPSATGSSEVGRGLAVVDVVPAIYGDALAGSNGTIVIAVTLSGVTSGDSRQSTGELEFPLLLCNDCLFSCAEEDDMPIAEHVLSCAPGQDNISLLSCPAS